MVRARLRIVIGIVCVMAFSVIAVAFGQANLPTSSMDQLLTEVRGLRAELTQAASASIRAQLLVARLQLQEQRINTVARQLADVQRELAVRQQGQAATAVRLKDLQEVIESNRLSGEEREAVEHELRVVGAAIQQEEKRDQELRAQEISLSGILGDEQARWSDFNSRLDELERQLPIR